MANWLTENWVAKLISLILAVGLWFYAVGEEGVEVTRTIPVHIKLESEKLSVVGNPTRVILATLQAPRSLLANLASEELKAEHQIRKVETPGDYSFRLEPREIRLPSEKIRVTRIEPEVIQVKIDEMIVQKLEINPAFLGEPAFGYHLDPAKVQVDPRAVLVEGPKSQLEKLTKIKTQPIDVVGRVRSFRKTVRLADEVGLRVLGESLVDVYVPIQEAAGEKTFEKVRVKILGASLPQGQVSVEPPQLNLILRGAAKDLEAVDPARLLAYVEISGLSEGTHPLPIQTVLPEAVFLKENPPVVSVKIEKKNS